MFPYYLTFYYYVLYFFYFISDNFSASDPSDESSNNEPFSSEDTLATSKRKRFPSTKLRFYDDFDLPASKKKSQETVKVIAY